RRAVKYPVYRWFIPRFDAYLVVGERVKQYLRHYGAPSNRCFAAPHAVDNDRFKSESDRLRPRRTSLRKEFGLPEDGVVFLFVGKFIPLKRTTLFVDAVARAATQVPKICGLMVGDGPLRGEAEQRA